MVHTPTEVMSDGAAPLLLTPLKIRSLTLRNRIVASPMCQYESRDGAPGDWQLVNFGKFAVGGAALVFGEETAIEAAGRKSYACAGLWNDSHIASYRRITDFIKAQGASPGVQLGHAGGRGSCHDAEHDWRRLTDEDAHAGMKPWECLVPSALPAQGAWPKVRVMDASDIRAHLQCWRDATLRALDAGYEVLEIHGAHGYLIHQFLSPVMNHRTDGYGGSREARMRMALEIAETVRRAWPATLPLFFRVSAVDGKGGAWGIEDTVALACALRERGVDVVDCSSGGISGDSSMPIVRRVPGYQVEFAAQVRRQANIATMAVGLITRANQAEQILREGRADLVALARELIWDPNWPARAARELMGEDGYQLLPESQSNRLIRREVVARLPVNSGIGVASAADDELAQRI